MAEGVKAEEVQNNVESKSESTRGEENHINKGIRHLFIILGRAPM